MKYRMLTDWQEDGAKGPKKGEIVDLTEAREVLDDYGNLEYWLFEYHGDGEFYELYFYEVEPYYED